MDGWYGGSAHVVTERSQPLIARMESGAYADPAMRVRSISVRKLFGRFDHTIPLNHDERITIIHGPNGYGKTALLRLVDAAFGFDMDTLVSLPFETLRVDLDDGCYLEVSAVTLQRLDEEVPGMRYLFGEGEQPLVDADFHERSADPENSYAEQRYSAVRHELSRAPTAREMLDILRRERPWQSNSSFLHFWLSLVPVDFISVQRLFTRTKHPYATLIRRDKKEGEPLTFNQTVLVYSKELSDAVWRAQADYASEIQDLDRTFPKRLMAARASWWPMARSRSSSACASS